MRNQDQNEQSISSGGDRLHMEVGNLAIDISTRGGQGQGQGSGDGRGDVQSNDDGRLAQNRGGNAGRGGGSNKTNTSSSNTGGGESTVDDGRGQVKRANDGRLKKNHTKGTQGQPK